MHKSIACLVVALAVAVTQSTRAETLTTLYTFSGGVDGAYPQAGLVLDTQGNLYGTAYGGGSVSCTGGCGLVFEITPTGSEKVLHSFLGGADGANPGAALIRDSQGNLYGTTYYGGSYGYGTVFELTPTGVETVLHAFTGGTDGGFPNGGLVMDKQGHFYGTTTFGGLPNTEGGVVFEMTPDGTETVLYSFGATNGDGVTPQAGLILDAQGNLYGTTLYTGTYRDCCGTVFKVTPTGVATVLHTFTNYPDGAFPWSSLVFDTQGNLYGTTYGGGSYGYGTVFEITQLGTEMVIYSFKLPRFSSTNSHKRGDGANPVAGLVFDTQGNLYGTTKAGGVFSRYCIACGTIFKITPTGSETVLYGFTGGADGAYPYSSLVFDTQGNLYGTTSDESEPLSPRV